jgi:hypothetical protein
MTTSSAAGLHSRSARSLRSIFLAVAEGARQCSLDRTKAEAEGSAWLYRGGAAVRLFYSAAGRAEVEAKWARTRAEIRRFADLLEHGDLLGLGAKFTREDVMRAFRLQAQKHRPDKAATRKYSAVSSKHGTAL